MTENELREIDVRGTTRQVGFYSYWSNKAPVKCPLCGTYDTPHHCTPAADEAQEFFRCLVLVDAIFRGKPLEPIDWFDTTIDVVWGTMVWDDKAVPAGWYRLYQDVVLNIIRGAMKTVFLASTMIKWLAEANYGAVAAFAQQTQEESIAKLVPLVLDMIELCPLLDPAKFRWIPDTKTAPGGGNRFTRGEGRGEVSLKLVSPANIRVATNAKGPRYEAGFFDETGFMQSGEVLINESVKKGNIAHPDPLWFQASTQSPDPAHHQRRLAATCLEVEANPALNPRLYSVNYVSDAQVDVLDRNTAINLNPLFRLKIASESIIDQELAEAALDADLLTTYARERCGYAGDYTVRFMDRNDWMACAVSGKTMKERRNKVIKLLSECEKIYLGSDYSEVSDLSASCFWGIHPSGKGIILPYHFIPSSIIKKLDALTRGKVAFWMEDRWLEVLPAGPTLPETVAKRTLEYLKPFEDKLDLIGYDRWHAEGAATLMRNALGCGPDIAVHVNQGSNLSEPIHAARSMAEEKMLVHPGDPVLDFGVFSAETEPGKTDPDKSQLKKVERGSSPDRIDGVIAWMTAWQAQYDKEAFESRQKKKQSPKPYIPRSMREKQNGS